MTQDQFNQKYKGYIEEGFDGLMFDIPPVTDFLDTIFPTLIAEGKFSFSQIKLKFGRCRFYSTSKMEIRYFIEDIINSIITKIESNESRHSS